jgi:capsid protein
MAEPLTFLEKSWQGGRRSGGDRLVEASRQNSNRRFIPDLATDTHKAVSAYSRRQLLTLGKWLFSNYDAIRGPLRKMATHASRNVAVDVQSADQEWDNRVEQWLTDNEDFCDYRGQPHTLRQWRRQLILSIFREGDAFTFLTKSPYGNAWIQPVMSHRIRCFSSETVVDHGPWNGNQIVDGIILDKFGRPVAYRYVPGDGYGVTPGTGGVVEKNELDESITYTVLAKDGSVAYVDISRRAMIPSFLPDYGDQIRGFSLLGASLFEWQDLKERRSLELSAQKLGASIGLIEHNEDGTEDLAMKMARDAEQVAAGGEAFSTVDTRSIGGVEHRYYKAGQGGGLETLKFDRPSANVQEHEKMVKRDALNGIGWSYDLTDPTGVSGGALRWCIEECNATIEELLCLVLVPAQRRVDNYRVENAIQLGAIPKPPKGGYRLNYQPGKKLTADAKYDAQVAQLAIEMGTGTRKQFAAQAGNTVERNIEQLGREYENALTLAEQIQKRHPDQTIDSIVTRILAGLNPSIRPQFDEQIGESI